MEKIMIISLVILLCSSYFSGCIEEEMGDGAEIDEGTLRLQITDKPDDLDIIHANVTIPMVQVHKSGASDGDDDEEEDNGTDDGFNVDAGGAYEGSVGDLIQFEGNASGGIGPYNWSWVFGDGNFSYEQNPQHAYMIKGEYNVNLTVTDDTNATAWDETKADIGNDDGENNSTAGWYTIVNESQTFDLIALQNVTDLMGEKNLSTGKYTQIRLTVEQAVIVINNSGEIEVHDLEIPSNKVKLIKSFWIYENKTTVLTLDFDVDKSVHITGSDKYMMKPTIKVIQG
ncbi:MAG: DUF4382 domain-containing protein [Thermoplasmatales archaeon]|nr:MAG: DUF4382 domain-containing protein [Thermoplasmatales archaeon]